MAECYNGTELCSQLTVPIDTFIDMSIGVMLLSLRVAFS